MRLVALLEPAQDRDRVRYRRLADEDRLEPPLQSRVLLDVPAVFVERRGADAAQLAAREHRLEQVPCRHGTLRRAGADDRVQLVDEEDDLALRRLDLVQDRLQPLLELAAVLRPCDQRADVERPHALALQPFRHVAGDDPLREALGDRRLPHARIADQHGVVLGAARKHLDDAANLLVAPDDGIELAFLGGSRQVAAELLERLVGLLGILGRDALPAADGLDLRFELVARNDVEREQQVLGRHVVVLQAARLVGGPVEHARERRRHVRLLLHALHRRLAAQRRLGLRAQRRRIRDELLRQLLVEQREQQVLGIQLGVAHPARELLCGRDGFL